MFDVIHNGKKYGTWDEDNIGDLAKRLGVSVDALMTSTRAYNEKLKVKTKFKRAVKKRAGDTSKILEITADTATMSILLNCAFINAIEKMPEGDFKASFVEALSVVMPGEGENEIFSVMRRLSDDVKSGDVKIVGHIKGSKTVIDAVGGCNTAVVGVVTEAAAQKPTGGKAAKDAPKA